MQVAVLWSVIAALVLASGAALLRQWQLLRGARERERLLDRQLAHACGFALAAPLAAAGLQELGRALDAIPDATGNDQLGHVRENVRALMALLQPHERSREPFDANEMAQDALRLFAPEGRRHGVELVLLPCPGTAVLAGERSELQLALLQLVANALEAMQETPLAHRRVLVATHLVAAGVQLQVSDRGHGLGARRPEALFSPYSTSRPGHMGLGLKVARRVVQAHGGRLEARRRAGGGAVFTMTLPRGVAASATRAAHSTSFTAPCVVQP
jgi:signal transduction histidine kinase